LVFQIANLARPSRARSKLRKRTHGRWERRQLIASVLNFCQSQGATFWRDDSRSARVFRVARAGWPRGAHSNTQNEATAREARFTFAAIALNEGKLSSPTPPPSSCSRTFYIVMG